MTNGLEKAKKLTGAQVAALKALPCRITTWGGKPFAGMPQGIRSRTTLYALSAKGLVREEYSGTTEIWTITPLGLTALEAADAGMKT